tara:strand:- start:2015 stop:2644 length:630 start_codon:yes stop_codon:yes gene_type:complete
MTDDNIEERLNDEGFSMNNGFDSEEGYNILHRLGIPPTMKSNGMGVGEYDHTFYSKMMNQAKIMKEKEKEVEFKDELKIKYELNNGDDNMTGYISNEIYYPIQKDKKIIEKTKDTNTRGGLMEIPVGELMANTSTVLNNFEDEFLRSLHKVDMDFGYSNTGNGFVKNVKRYILAFMVYLQEGNNILYIGITLLIISIILYFINIIRKND